DVSSEAEWQEAIAAALAAFGKLDILVNDAGISGSDVEDLFDTAAWQRLMAVNATGAFLGMKFAIREMKKAGGGSIVNISSISGVTGQRGIHVGYNASKGAVRTLTKAAAVQHGRDNIRVNSVHPGLMPPMRSSGRTADPALRGPRFPRGACPVRPTRPAHALRAPRARLCRAGPRQSHRRQVAAARSRRLLGSLRPGHRTYRHDRVAPRRGRRCTGPGEP